MRFGGWTASVHFRCINDWTNDLSGRPIWGFQGPEVEAFMSAERRKTGNQYPKDTALKDRANPVIGAQQGASETT
ncbi:hypothetical protein L1049_028142 [Liquidambar formosana]|uniref:Uncharacterized protein n=1 Tax=Liquidambar formosana TaxID=63359 RepID=A0AAP0RKG0_LIQFO